jgi:hypothetical protein
VRASPRAESRRRAKITASLDWIDGGAWLRPDLALVHVHRRRFEPTPLLDLYTFEVKPKGTRGLPGLHQTLAQGRIGDFVLFVLADEDVVAPDVLEQASRYGVGIVTASDVRKWDTYRLAVKPQRMAPDPDLRDQFLTRAFDGETGNEVLNWLGVGPNQ